MKLFTARYSNKNIPASGLVPVRITLGHPRFKLAYPLVEKIMELAPPRSIFHLEDQGLFRAGYYDHLNRLGGELICRRLLETSARYSDAGLVLCCFENLRHPDVWCHRRLFADWWQERTGESIPELSEVLQPVLL